MKTKYKFTQFGLDNWPASGKVVLRSALEASAVIELLNSRFFEIDITNDDRVQDYRLLVWTTVKNNPLAPFNFIRLEQKNIGYGTIDEIPFEKLFYEDKTIDQDKTEIWQINEDARKQLENIFEFENMKLVYGETYQYRLPTNNPFWKLGIFVGMTKTDRRPIFEPIEPETDKLVIAKRVRIVDKYVEQELSQKLEMLSKQYGEVFFKNLVHQKFGLK